MNYELHKLGCVGGQYIFPLLWFETHCQVEKMEIAQCQLNCVLIWFDNSSVRFSSPGKQEGLKLQ